VQVPGDMIAPLSGDNCCRPVVCSNFAPVESEFSHDLDTSEPPRGAVKRWVRRQSVGYLVFPANLDPIGGGNPAPVAQSMRAEGRDRIAALLEIKRLQT